ncbi:TonB-dependent receptor [Pasteurella atlantica]|uniref:TonB-dependent receptor plug domain-containing protein n=1 Tax=Pasteurellaceae TaxID=712 RepID=UPI0027691D69|nr:TonB-dependent receptor [Pasteurella atlantica]MDP8033803.1 TonB-dependent receptor [Pasteurella atlantica]MDP8035738.1 TonB-dependent receptor [Pasteurella atlantica]MDP8037726.1 TonB-dependent receptor [Pasteurella atlantica]MDP8048038.1 TonB-dependent receptor [Pasteurella atlantica]MDP8050062.1 TonB-dependent receptor [Pasteurella atlantica]
MVYGQQNTGLSSTQKITSKEIAKTPVSNGNISDYLKSNSHIRFENSDETSLMRGEIKPAEISINGAEESQTSYYVDNVNINNDLGNSSEGFFDGTFQMLPKMQSGQGYFFDANLLSSVVVHDSNVSASLGGFSGGAVVAKTKYYDGTDRVKLRYRTSRSQWAKFELNDTYGEGDAKRPLSEIFNSATPLGAEAPYQPDYKKTFFSISAERALTDKLGVVAGISRRESDIQQSRIVSMDKETGKVDLSRRNHTRRSDNALINFNYAASDDDRFELGLRYSKYSEGKFFDVNIDSDLYDYHNAYGATLAWVHSLDNGVVTSTLAYDKFKDERYSSATKFSKTLIEEYDENYNIIPKVNFEKGGMGTSTLKQQNIHYSMEYAINPFELGSTSHSVSVGGLYQQTKYNFNRKQDVESELTQITFIPAMPDIGFEAQFIEGDKETVHYKKGSVKAKYQNLALYAEDLIRVGNFDFRPGIRIERDDFLKNTNIAPRFVASWSPLEETSMSLGLNRYYGRSFAVMALTEQVYKLDDSYGSAGKPQFRYKNLRDFKTPYSDELSLGFSQHYKNVSLDLGFIHRKHKNRIVLDEQTEKEFDLNGRENRFKLRQYKKGNDYSVDIYTLKLSNKEAWQLGKTYWNTSLNFDWLETKSVDMGLGYNPNEIVNFNGTEMTRSQMMKKINNNRENWTVRLGLDMQVPDYNLDWTNKVYVKAPIKGANNTAGNTYESYNYGSHVQWDTGIRWAPKFGQHSPYIKLDVLNVLNKTRKGMTSRGINNGFYTAGREFWLELGYEF